MSSVLTAIFSRTKDTELADIANTLPPYDAIVYVMFGRVIARDKKGVMIRQGVDGTDNAAVINAAISSLTAGRTSKETVLIYGNHTVSTNINPASYTRIVIVGKISAKAATACDVIRNNTTNLTDIEVVGGEVYGNAHNATPNSGIYLPYVANAVVRNVKVTNTGHVGIYLKGCHYCKVIDNMVRDCGEATNTLVGTGIAVFGARGAIIRGNHVIDCDNGGTLMHGIQIETDDEFGQGGFRDAIIADNVCYSNGGAGIILSNASRVIIQNNQVSVNGLQGIDVETSNFITIIGNVHSDNGQKTNQTYDEIYLTSNRCIIADNLLYSSAGNPRTRNGIMVGDNAAGHSCHIKGNYIESMFNASIIVYGDGHKIEGNRITQDIGRGIRLETTADSCIVQHNSIGGNITTLVEDLGGAVTANKKLRNKGYVTENNVLSGTFAIDSTGVKTVTIAHGLSITPALQDIALTVVEDSDVDDWAYNLLKIEGVGATNVTVKINVSTASATGGATAKIAMRVGRQ